MIRNKGVQLSLKLLDRYAKDGSLATTTTTETTKVLQPLNVVLRQWKESYLEQYHHCSGDRSGSIKDQSSSDVVSPHQMLRKLDEWRSTSDYLRPDGRSYAIILEAATAATTTAAAAVAAASETGAVQRAQSAEARDHDADPTRDHHLHFADSLLHRLIEESQTDYTVQPMATSFVHVMHAWAQQSQQQPHQHQQQQQQQQLEDGPVLMIQRWIDRMHELHQEGWPGVEPTVVVYNVLLNAMSRAGAGTAIDQMEELLRRMLQGEIPGISPDTVSFGTLLSAYARQQTPEAALKAESLLTQMQDLHDNGIESVQPNTITYTNVMECHAKSASKDAGERAEAILRRLEQRYLANNDDNNNNDNVDVDLRPDLAAYHAVLNAYVSADGPEQADRFLLSMLDDVDGYLANVAQVQPNHRSFNIVMGGWANRGDYERAQSTLLQMHELHSSGELETKPDVVSYNIVLDALAKAGRTGAAGDGNDAQNRAKRGKDILHHMEELYRSGDEGVKPNTRTWNTCINIFAKAGMIDEAEELLQKFSDTAASYDSETVDGTPGVRTWNTVLSACMVRGNVGRAMSIWHRMTEEGIQADTVTYNTLLNCYVRAFRQRTNKSHKTVKSARRLFYQMRHDRNVQPNHITYLAMINVFLNADDVKAAQAFLFDRIEDYKSQQGSVLPDRTLFHRVLTAWAPRKTPRKAEEFCRRMAEAARYCGSALRPNTETYNLLLQCWSKSTMQESGERAETILRQLEATLRPNIDSYNATLSAWKNSGDLTALLRIDGLFLEMILKGDLSLMPDATSYGIWLDAIAQSTVADKSRKLTDVIKMMTIHNSHSSFSISEELKRKIEDLRSVSGGDENAGHST